MLTNKITGFSADLLNTVRGILGEAKKCSEGCECEKCEAEQMKEGSMPTADEPTDANKKTADKVRAMLAKEKKLKEDIMEMVEEASSGLADKAKKSGVSLSTLKKVYARGIAAWNSGHRPGTTPQQWAHARVNSYITKGKGTYHGADKDLRSEGADMPFEGPYRKAGEERKDEYGNKVKNVAKHLAKKAMKANEEVEDLDETAKIVAHLQKRYGDNIRKSHVRSAASDFGVDASKLAKAVRTKLGKNMLDEEDDGWYTHSQMHGSKKSEKHPKGISAAEWKSGIRWHHGKNKRINIKEEVEELDEISKATMGRYINKAKDSIDMASYRQGHKEAHGSSSKPLEKKLTKRHKGIETAVKKLTKEESEQIDELSKATLGSYIKKATNQAFSKGYSGGSMMVRGDMNRDSEYEKAGEKNVHKAIKRVSGVTKAVNKLTQEEQDFVDSLNNEMFEGMDNDMPKGLEDRSPRGRARNAMGRAIAKKERNLARARKEIASRNEEAEITEARGRPRKAGAKDFTIHPKTKEKLMHNNPEHMKKIEVLQKNGILEKPKVEAGQHIMNQLSKAKTSMLGGSKINFTHGDSKEVSGTHAAKILTKYAGMKPDEKEAFQKFVGHSHENLMKHV